MQVIFPIFYKHGMGNWGGFFETLRRKKLVSERRMNVFLKKLSPRHSQGSEEISWIQNSVGGYDSVSRRGKTGLLSEPYQLTPIQNLHCPFSTSVFLFTSLFPELPAFLQVFLFFISLSSKEGLLRWLSAQSSLPNHVQRVSEELKTPDETSFTRLMLSIFHPYSTHQPNYDLHLCLFQSWHRTTAPPLTPISKWQCSDESKTGRLASRKGAHILRFVRMFWGTVIEQSSMDGTSPCNLMSD